MEIKKVKIIDNKVNICFENYILIIGIETYLNTKLLVGDEIDEEEVQELKKSDVQNNVRSKLIEKISRKKLSKKECESFLSEALLDNVAINKIVNDLENNYLINDVELSEAIIDYCLINKKGINIIKKKLNERKIEIDYDAFVDKYLDINKYQNNIKYLVDKYKKIGSKKSNKVLKMYIKNKLLENGYNIEEICDYLEFDDVDEFSSILSEVKKFFSKNIKNNENIAKITKKLLSKGFNYDIIKKAIRECEDNETY